MLSVSAVKPLNLHNNKFIQPGGVCSVGQTSTLTRYRQSCPEMPPRIKITSESGSNCVDGNNQAMFNIGSGPKTIRKTWFNPKRSKIGYIVKDLRAVDRNVQPIMGDQPQYDWQNKIATAYTHNKSFDAPPGGFAPKPGDIPRGPVPQTYNISNSSINSFGYLSNPYYQTQALPTPPSNTTSSISVPQQTRPVIGLPRQL